MPKRIKEFKVITPNGIKPKPNDYEKKVARIMAEYLQSDILFIKRSTSTTPDILEIRLNQIWEIKNIRGSNQNTIGRNLKGIYRQSENVIITLFRTSMSKDQAVGRIRQKLARANRIKRLVLITRAEKLVIIKQK